MSASLEFGLETALQRCHEQLVHSPGAIQPNGALLAFDEAFAQVRVASANLADYLHIDAAAALERTPGELLGGRIVKRLLRSLESDITPAVISFERHLPGAGVVRLQLTAYRSNNRVVVEVEHLPRRGGRRWLVAVNDWLARLARAQSQDDLLQQLVLGVQDLTGHERVMVYQFDEAWHGVVVAEHLAGGVDSFLGHRFPASDIPPQVRALYDVNPVRSIPDARTLPVPLLSDATGGAAAAAGELDLSRGFLRAVSPIHLQYLANMGVGSSLSIAMHGADGLWGLVACHGSSARQLQPPARDAALSLARMATQRLFLLKARADARYLQRVLDSRELLSEKRGQLTPPMQLLEEHGREWLGLFHACGVALVHGDLIACYGRTPGRPVLVSMAHRLTATHQQHGPWVSHALQQTSLAEAGDLAGCCGLLALRLDVDSPPGWLLLFRPEQIVAHRWAGDARAPAELDQRHGTLNPRSSFASWMEEVRGQARRWQDIEIHAAADLAEDLAVATSVHRIALLNARLEEANRHLNEIAHTDTLTQAWNRYRMEQALEEEFAAAARYGRPCSIILLDIDHFKQFNDRHGHAAGDQVLVTVASEIQASLRNVDHLGRWGGEEFIILVANNALGEAEQLAERLRQHVAALDFGPLGRVTFSAGVAQWRDGDTRRSLLERADQALYRAKRAGRNQVCREDNGAATAG